MRAHAASWLITGDPEQAPLAGGALVLDGDARIVAVGRSAELRARYPDARWEDHRAVLIPGLVNAHTHLELSGLRGRVPGGAGFGPWVSAMMGARDQVRPEGDLEAIDLGVSELLAAGTAAVGEISNSLASVASLGQVPLRGVVFHEVFGLRREVAEVMLGMAEQRRAEFPHWPERLGYALAPHTPYSLHPEVLRDLVERARSSGGITSIHLCEHAAERAYLRDHTGPFADFIAARGADSPDWAAPACDPVQYVADLGLLGQHLLCVHLADARPEELARVAAANARVVLCPRSNLHIEVRLPPLLQMLALGMRPALGTDSLASNSSLDVLDEARALHARFPSVPARTLIAMATSYGARALGLERAVGQLAVGLQPGVVAFAHEGAPPSDPERFVLSPRSTRRQVLAHAG
jgi:aminodeoxyfutalosine deaminase